MADKKKNAKLDNHKEDTGSIVFLKENGMLLRLVADSESGEGLPYAPINWPKHGDVWGWKAGKRIYGSGFMADRSLCLPESLQKPGQPKLRFASLQSAKLYIKTEFPEADSDAFFASFSWKIPAKKHNWPKDQLYIEEKAEHSGSRSNAKDMGCKAGNKMCSVQPETKSGSLPAMDCNLCCSETGFCRNCCCILCCRTIVLVCEDYSFIRCEAKLSETHICGHIAHINCAVRSFMAGTVGGDVIALDAEYYCRRCDRRTDLVPHVTKLLKTCQSLDHDDVENALKVGLSVLRGSKRDDAMRLLNHINLTLAKLKSATIRDQIWNLEDDTSVDPKGAVSHPGNNGTFSDNLQVTDGQYPLNLAASHNQAVNTLFWNIGAVSLPGNNGTSSENVQLTNGQYPLNLTASHEPACTTSNHQRDSSKADEEINQVLQQLRKSQEIEYRIAEERLKAKKVYLVNLYEQLDKETRELAKQSPSTMDGNVNSSLSYKSEKLNQIKQELIELKDMKEIGKGFGRTPRGILKEHFGLQLED